MIQQRRIMFVKNSQPLVGARVRLGKVSGALLSKESKETLPNLQSHYVTDQDGQISCELDSGISFIEVFEEEEWVECRLEVTEKQSLFVVDLHTHTTGNFKQITGGMGAVPGQVFGERYIFDRVIGRGGMGVVIKAQDKLLHRDVAIKMLNDEFLENMEAQKIFLEEARSLATLRHPNLVSIYDVTMIDGRAMIVFELIEGRDLDSIFEEVGRLSEASVLRIGVQLARALKHLHSKGILHRDIKPANVLMQPDGMLKIIDFGLARPLEQLAIKGTRVRGTPAYMAPEQIEGGQLLAATDIYQLGVSLYEVLSGQLPFATGNMAYAHVHLDPPDLNAMMSLREPKLATLIHACLAKRPEDRPSAQELFQAFQAIYASHAPYYDQDTVGVVPNTDALFSETTELTIPDWLNVRKSENQTLSELPLTSTPTPTQTQQDALLVVDDDDELEPEGLQRLLVMALALILLLLGLGGVIVMLVSAPPVQEKDAPSAQVGVLDEPQGGAAVGAPDEETASTLKSSSEVRDAPPLNPPSSREDVKEQDDEGGDGGDDALAQEPVERGASLSSSPAPSPDELKEEDAPARNVRTTKKDPPVKQPLVSQDPVAKTDQDAQQVPPSSEDPSKGGAALTAPDEDRAPDTASKGVEAGAKTPDNAEAGGGNDPEPRVIRKRIIRKRVIQKTPAANETDDTTTQKKSSAPVSF